MVHMASSSIHTFNYSSYSIIKFVGILILIAFVALPIAEVLLKEANPLDFSLRKFYNAGKLLYNKQRETSIIY
jgi:hypothetical protein